MLGAYTLLPLLSGWDYKPVIFPTRTVTRGAAPIEVYRLDEEGWLISLELAATDAYGTLHCEFQGAELETRLLTANAEALRTAGAWMPQSGGFLNRYWRPVAASTAGLYYAIVYATSGEFLPYVRTVIAKYELPSTSTQTSAIIAGGVFKVAIIDKKKFILSLRNVLGIKEKDIDMSLIPGGKT